MSDDARVERIQQREATIAGTAVDLHAYIPQLRSDVQFLLGELVSLRAARDTAEQQIAEFWTEVERGYDIESKAEIEAEAKANWNPPSPIVVAMHLIWKRNPKVAPLLAQLATLTAKYESLIQDGALVPVEERGIGPALWDEIVTIVRQHEAVLLAEIDRLRGARG